MLPVDLASFTAVDVPLEAGHRRKIAATADVRHQLGGKLEAALRLRPVLPRRGVSAQREDVANATVFGLVEDGIDLRRVCLMQVRCAIVVRLKSFWICSTISRVFSRVLPPAP